jgi:type 1 fimbria pilin
MTHHFRIRHLAGACALAALVIAARPGLAASQAAPEAPIYDVRVEVDQVSTGTTTFSVDKTGKVSGTMHIDAPNVVEAKLAGTVKDGVWTFEYPFTMTAQGCSGTVSGTAKVSADQKLVSGSMTIGGGCVEQPMTATFTFTKRTK